MIDLIKVTKQEPCKHCGKHDYCYRLTNGLEVCNRFQVAEGWKATSKRDDNDKPFLAPIEATKSKPKATSKQEWLYRGHHGQLLVKVTRQNYDNGSKRIYQSGLKAGKWVNSLSHIDRKEIAIYEYAQIRQAIANNETIFFVEGEKCADMLWGLGLAATTNLGGSSGLKDSDLEDLTGANLVIVPDCDLPGLKLAAKVYAQFPNAQWLYVDPSSKSWEQEKIAPGGGYDIADWIEDKNLTAEQIVEAIEPYRGKLIPEVKELIAPEAEQHYTEKAVEALYSDGKFLAIGDDLYRFNGKCYEKLGAKREQRRIADWCRSNPVEISQQRWKFSYANAATTNNIWSWLLIRFGVEPEEINPPGLNLKNGVLRLYFSGNDVKWSLRPHSPDYLYTYCVEVDYDPKADDFNCDRLLACLDEQQQIILLRSIAGSFDLSYIRGKQGRAIKALLLHGDGSNGKDSLRAVTHLLFGESMVSMSISDFQSYDQGVKNPLVKLAKARISWSSENTKSAKLESLNSLKNAITGEPLDIREMFQSAYEMEPKAIFIFNCNEPPSVIGGSRAILDRYAILKFEKTFKKGADIRNNEIEADPRFRYDPEFLAQEVAPAFLNKILEQLPKLLKEGIDYSSVDKAFDALQQESNHLWQFCQETGISYVRGGKIYIKDLWESLKAWYQVNGTLEIEIDSNGKEKIQWNDQVNPRDKNIKGANQIFKRFSELFPNVKKMSETTNQDRLGQAYLSGIGQTASCDSYPHESKDTASYLPHKNEAVNEATTQSYRQYEAHEAVWGITLTDAQLIELVKKRFSEMSPELKQKLIDELVSSQGESVSESVKPPIDPKNPKRVNYKDKIYLVLTAYEDSLEVILEDETGDIFWVKRNLIQIIE
jgi:phage/plasmid-associated DNA primase